MNSFSYFDEIDVGETDGVACYWFVDWQRQMRRSFNAVDIESFQVVQRCGVWHIIMLPKNGAPWQSRSSHIDEASAFATVEKASTDFDAVQRHILKRL